MLSKRSQNHRKKSIWIIAGTGIVLAVILICASVFYIGRNPSEQTSHVTIMFGRVPKEPLRLNESFDQGTGSSGLPGVSFELAEGYDNPDEKGVIQAVTGADGTADFDVPEGEYTLRWQKAGYYGGYQNVKVQGETVVLRKWLIRGWLNPDSSEEEPWAYILLEWESEENLDLCVYQEKNGRCIGIEPTMDAEGSFLYDDNNGAQGYELVFLKNVTIGNYRVYVKDCDSILNDCGSRMGAAGVSVSIYTAQGIVYQKKAETEENAGLWECAGLCGGEVTEQDQYFYDLTEHGWALRNGNDPASWLEGACTKAEEVYHYRNNGLDMITRKEFDKEGNQTVEVSYNMVAEPTYRYEYEYDGNGNLIAECRLALKGGESDPVKVWEAEYNEDGELIGYCKYSMDGLVVSQYLRTYDADGNLIREYTYPYPEGEYGNNSSEECQYEYDADGHRTAEISYVDGEKTYRQEYEYDEDGKEIVCYVYCCYSTGDFLERRCESEYDENGRLKVYTLYIYSGDIVVTEYGYDTDGNCIAEYICSYSEDGTLNYRERFEFHTSGKVTLHAVGHGEFWESLMTNEYDDLGNETASYFYRYDGNEVSLVSSQEYEYQYDDLGNETAFYRYEDGVRLLLRATEYVYDARAGMKIAYRYENGYENNYLYKTITIYDYGIRD